VQQILTKDLNMKRVSAKFVPRILTPAQKQKRVSTSLELRDRVASDPNFLKSVITGDESWVCGYEIQNSVENTQLTSTEKSTPIEIQHQGDVDCFPRFVGNCAKEVRA